MDRARRNSLLTLFAIAATAAGIALYAQKAGFTESWQKLIEQEFAKRGYEVDIQKLTLSPTEGLVAEDVKFYQERTRRTEIAAVDKVILDVDLGRVFEKKLSLNSIDFKKARLSLPLDPADPNSARLDLDNFSARAVMSDQEVEIVHATALVHGLPVSLKGRLYQPLPTQEEQAASEPSKKQLKEERKAQLERITSRLGVFAAILAQLEQFEFPGLRPGQGVEIDVSGNLADIGSFTSRCEINLGTIRRGPLVFDRLRALFEFNNQRLSLQELILGDASGELQINADWPLDSGQVHFKLESTIDAPKVLTTLSPHPGFGEVVFFAPPRIQFEGDWTLRPEAAVDPALPAAAILPIDGVGSFSCDRLASRGVVFDSFRSDFRISGDKLYGRNLRLDHQTGVAKANILYDLKEGIRYQAEVKFDPVKLLPFVTDEEIRRHMLLWSFQEDSTIYIGVEGEGPEISPSSWQTRGVIDLRRCRYSGVEIDHFESDFESSHGRHHFKNVSLECMDEDLSAVGITVDTTAKTIELDSLDSTLPTTTLASLTTPQLKKISQYLNFSSPPHITSHGTVHFGESTSGSSEALRNDLRIGLSIEDPLVATLAGHSLTLTELNSAFHLDDTNLQITKLSALAFGGQLTLVASIPGAMAPGPSTPIEGEFVLDAALLMNQPPLRQLAPLLRPLRITDDATTPVHATCAFTITDKVFFSDAVVISSEQLEMNGTASLDLRTLELSEAKMTAQRTTAPPTTTTVDVPAPAAAPRPRTFSATGLLSEPQWSR